MQFSKCIILYCSALANYHLKKIKLFLSASNYVVALLHLYIVVLLVVSWFLKSVDLLTFQVDLLISHVELLISHVDLLIIQVDILIFQVDLFSFQVDILIFRLQVEKLLTFCLSWSFENLLKLFTKLKILKQIGSRFLNEIASFSHHENLKLHILQYKVRFCHFICQFSCLFKWFILAKFV